MLIGETFVVVWEGTDASGKTTLMNSVVKELEVVGLRVITYKTPSDTPTGRFAATYGNEPDVDPLARMLLFLANTVDDSRIMRELVAKEKPEFLFIDRYYLCSIVYGLAINAKRFKVDVKGKVVTLLREVEHLGAGRIIEPDLYLLIYVDEAERMRRATSKEGADRRFELDAGLQGLVIELYEEFARVVRGKATWIKNERNKLRELTAQISEMLVRMRNEAIEGRSEGQDV